VGSPRCRMRAVSSRDGRRCEPGRGVHRHRAGAAVRGRPPGRRRPAPGVENPRGAVPRSTQADGRADMKRSLQAALAIALLAAAPVLAETTVLRAARYLDVAAGRFVEPAVIVVEDGRILAVDPETVPAGRVVDLGDRTLLPGLMDAHTHLSTEVEP